MRGWQAESINRRRTEEEKEQENKERSTSGSASYTASHRERCKERYKEMEKDKSPKAKGSQDNLRKAWQETSQAKARHSYLRISLCVLFIWELDGGPLKNAQSKTSHNSHPKIFLNFISNMQL